MGETLKLESIRTDGGTQPRASLSTDTVKEYCEALQAGTVFPPVIVFYDGTSYWLADGFHRYFATKENGDEVLSADIRQGTQRDAILYSLSANASHGLRRTNADKYRAVERLLSDEEWTTWSDRKIAEACGVTHPFVAKVRRGLSGGNDYHSKAFTDRPRGWTLPPDAELLLGPWASMDDLEHHRGGKWAAVWPSSNHPGHVYVSVIGRNEPGDGGGYEERLRRPVRVDAAWMILEHFGFARDARWFPCEALPVPMYDSEPRDLLARTFTTEAIRTRVDEIKARLDAAMLEEDAARALSELVAARHSATVYGSFAAETHLRIERRMGEILDGSSPAEKKQLLQLVNGAA